MDLGYLGTFAGTSLFRFLFCLIAVVFIASILVRYGLRSALAVTYGLYDVMILIFVFAVMIAVKGGQGAAEISGEMFNDLIDPVIPGFLSGSVDMHQSGSLLVQQYLFDGGKLLLLALILESLEKIADVLPGPKRLFLIWYFREAVIVSVGVSAYLLIYTILCDVIPDKTLHWLFILFLIVTTLCVMGVGVLAVFGPLGALLDGLCFSIFAGPCVSTIVTMIAAMFLDAMGWMDSFYQLLQDSAGISSPVYISQLAGLVLVFLLLWYVVYRMIRVKNL